MSTLFIENPRLNQIEANIYFMDAAKGRSVLHNLDTRNTHVFLLCEAKVKKPPIIWSFTLIGYKNLDKK